MKTTLSRFCLSLFSILSLLHARSIRLRSFESQEKEVVTECVSEPLCELPASLLLRPGFAKQGAELSKPLPLREPAAYIRGEEKRPDRCLLGRSKSPTVGTFVLDIDFCLIE